MRFVYPAVMAVLFSFQCSNK